MLVQRLDKKKIVALLSVGFLLTGLVAVGTIPVWGQTPSDVTTGDFQINAAPTITVQPDFQTDGYVSDEALDPDDTTWQRVNVTVSHSAGITDLLNLTFWIFDDSVYGSNYNTSVGDGSQLVQFLWDEASDTWSVSDQGSFSQWSIDDGASDDPGTGSGLTSFEFSVRFQISKAALADTDWNVTVHVYDDDGTPEIAYGSESTLVNMNDYLESAYSVTTFSWGNDIQPSSSNNTHDALTINTIYANTQWEITLSASNFTASGETDVTPETNDIISWDDDGSEGGAESKWIRNSTAIMLGTWDDQAPMSDESGFSRTVYIFLNPGALFVVGKTWSVIITVTLQANT